MSSRPTPSSSLLSSAFSSASHALKRELDVHTPIRLGQAQQILSAALGHNSLSSFQISDVNAFDHASYCWIDRQGASKRAQGLGLSIDERDLLEAIVHAIRAAAPALIPVSDLDEYTQMIQSEIDDSIINNDEVNSQMAMTNGQFQSINCPFEATEDLFLNAEAGDSIDLDIEGEVTVQQDWNRIYYGHRIEVEASISVPRLGRRLFGFVEAKVLRAELIWGGEFETSDDPYETQTSTFAIMKEFELSEEDMEHVEFDVIPETSRDGLIYGYIIDFINTPDLRIFEIIRERYPEMTMRVGPNFFDYDK